jgi:thiol-disulfide isomerase/thioredoxin
LGGRGHLVTAGGWTRPTPASGRSLTSQGDRSEAPPDPVTVAQAETNRAYGALGVVMSQGAWVLVAALVLAGGFGLWRAVSDGRFRGTRSLPAPADKPPAGDRAEKQEEDAEAASVLDDLGQELGERATLLQFSSAFCAPCRATRRVLSEVVGLVPGVAHVELDAEHHLDLVRRLGILRTPTTLVLDATGREVSRATGAPSRDAVLATLAGAL